MPTEQPICEQICHQIDDLMRADLRDLHLPTRVTEHVRECSACKAYLDECLALAEHLETWPVPEPKRRIETDVMTRIAQLERDHRFNLVDLAGQCRQLLLHRVRVPAALAALLVLGLFVSVTLNVRGWQRSEPQPILVNTPTVPVLPGMEGPIVPVASSPQVPIQVSGARQGLPSWMSTSQLAPSTYIIIMGAPPLSTTQGTWTTSPAKHSGNAL